MIAGGQSMICWCHMTSYPWSERAKWWCAWTLACVQCDFSTLTIQDLCLGHGDTHSGWWVAPPHLIISVSLIKTVPHRPTQWRQSQRQNWDTLLAWFYTHTWQLQSTIAIPERQHCLSQWFLVDDGLQPDLGTSAHAILQVCIMFVLIGIHATFQWARHLLGRMSAVEARVLPCKTGS